jgi:hypothetical protein
MLETKTTEDGMRSTVFFPGIELCCKWCFRCGNRGVTEPPAEPLQRAKAFPPAFRRNERSLGS